MTRPLQTTAVLLLLLACATARAEESAPTRSLFFTPQEVATAQRLSRQKALPGKGLLRLDALMYSAPDEWTFWLQGEKWTPQTTRDDIRVLDVTPTSIRILWKENAESAPQEITLKPDETYTPPP